MSTPGSYSAVELEAEHILPKTHRKGNCPTCGNPWERAARSEKVRRLVEAIDVELGHVSTGSNADAVADQLEAWPLEAWSQLANKARVLAPSLATVQRVVEIFRAR